jgi:hypothetical protein
VGGTWKFHSCTCMKALIFDWPPYPCESAFYMIQALLMLNKFCTSNDHASNHVCQPGPEGITCQQLHDEPACCCRDEFNTLVFCYIWFPDDTFARTTVQYSVASSGVLSPGQHPHRIMTSSHTLLCSFCRGLLHAKPPCVSRTHQHKPF